MLEKLSDFWPKIVIGAIVTVVLAFIGFLIWYVAWVNFVENYEYGFSYNKFTGEVKQVPHSGWIVATPWRYTIHKIDTRPYQVSITADLQSGGMSGINQRVLNAKLVRFNPIGLATFIEWHGRDAGDDLAGLKEILKCYAFDRDEGRDCPFLTVTGALAPSQSINSTEIIPPVQAPEIKK
jgi:hypothetical protein